MTCGGSVAQGGRREIDAGWMRRPLQLSIPRIHRAPTQGPMRGTREGGLLECRRRRTVRRGTHRRGGRGLRRGLVRGRARRHQHPAPAETGPRPERRSNRTGGSGASAARERNHAADSRCGAGDCTRGADRPHRIGSLRLHHGLFPPVGKSESMRASVAAWLLLLLLALVVVRYKPVPPAFTPPVPCVCL